MRDSSLRLQDKTIMLVGPFNGVTQACVRALTEFGCDVAYVSQDNPNAHRYIDGLNEAREIHAHYGRAVHYHMPLKSPEQVQEVLGAVTQSIGRIDALVDATPLTWDAQTEAKNAVDVCAELAEKCVPFFLAKQRGRLVFLFEDECLERVVPTTNTAAFRDMLTEKMAELAKNYIGKNITANAVAIGVTDDFLLKHNPKSPSLKKSLEALQAEHPTMRLVEYQDVALGVAYLISALSASVTGQTLRLTQGFHL
jgi:NAD(P)-dependent dehydrogenase (short-subunit alcohol dehydrogenase family)